jgi:hypothetical protein
MTAVYKLLDERRALDNPYAVDTLRDLLAMHWGRSPALRRAHERVAAEVVVQRIINTSRQPLMQQSGLVAAGQAELEWINTRTHQRIFEELDD